MSTQAMPKFEATTPPIRFEFRKGLFLSRVQLHLIYWGAHWREAKHPSIADLNGAVRKMIRPDGYLSGLAQYNRGCEPVVDLVETQYDLDPDNPPKVFEDDATHSDVVEEIESLMDAIERESPPDPHS